mgnify:CR=1 FL=1
MEISRLSFTKKTQDKMKKGMSVREKGKILFARLQELEEDGTLSKAKSRADVARLVGYPEERAKAGYAWVSNLIRRGHVSETIQEWTPSGKMVAEYHITGSAPDYGYEEAKRRKAKKEKIASEWVKLMPMREVEEKKPTNIKIEITRGDMSIKVEMDNHEEASKLITTIMKGE